MIQKRNHIVVWMLLLALVVTACGSDDSDKDKPYKVGIALTTTFQFAVSNPFKIEMEGLGYTEGENIEYITLLAASPDALGDTIDALIKADVDLIYTPGADEATVALARTDDIPIVFASGLDEVVVPLYEIQRSGTLITGVTLGDATTKRLDYLLKMDRSIKKVFAPYDPNNELSALGFALITEIAPELNVEIVGYETPDLATSQQAIDEMPADIDAIFMWTETFAVESWQQWADLALERKVSTSLPAANIEILDFLMGYGPELDVAAQQSAHMVDRILKGTPANQVPITQINPCLAINLAVAQQIDLEVPSTILAQACIIVRGELQDPAVVPELAGESGACNATLETPLGSTAGCVTVGCDALINTSLVNYADKVPVEACAEEGVIGICSTAGSSAYFYEGSIVLLEQGCKINNGTWSVPE